MKKDKTPFVLKVVRWIFPKMERVAPSFARRYFISLFFTPLRYPVPEKEKKAESFAKKFQVEVDGNRIQCFSWGDGKPVLFIHGWGGRATQFRRFVKPFNAAGYCVVGFDGPAHGQSEGKRTDQAQFELVLRKIYEAIGEPEAIIAHSFGGVAALYAAKNGLPIKKLINIASPTIGDEIIDTYVKTVNASPSAGDHFRQYVMETYGKPFDEFTSSYFVQHLPRPIPLLLIHDEKDKEVPIRQAEHLTKLYPSARLVRTSGLGHTRILKDDLVIRECVTFVTDGTSVV